MGEIIFPDKHKVLSGPDTIEFPAVVDGKTIKCRITLEEMIRDFARGRLDTFEDEFLRLRPQIEERAKQRIQAKRADTE